MSALEPDSNNPKRILLVEDNEDYAFTLVYALKKFCNVDHALTEEEALRLLYREDYDVLLLDLTLATGYLSGFQFLDYLKRQPRFKHLVVIGLSGMASADVHSNPSFEKLSAFLTKPVTANALIQTIHQCLAHTDKTASSDESNESAETLAL